MPKTTSPVDTQLLTLLTFEMELSSPISIHRSMSRYSSNFDNMSYVLMM